MSQRLQRQISEVQESWELQQQNQTASLDDQDKYSRKRNSLVILDTMQRGGRMSKSRREFLTEISMGLLSVSAGIQVQEQKPANPPPGAPPAFGTAQPVGPEVSPGTFAEAEKLVRVEMAASNRDEAAGNWRKSMAPLYERRTGPRKVSLQRELSPATVWDPVLPGAKAGPKRDRFIHSKKEAEGLPSKDEDIAFASV